MSAQAKKIIHFPESPAKAKTSACAQLRAVNEPMPLNNPFSQRLPELPACRRSEGAIGLGAALAFHLIWLAAASAFEKPAPVTPPTPIQVTWIASPQSRAEPPKPEPPKPQKKPKPAAKPKAKPRKPAPAKPKPLISASDSASEIAVAQTAETPKTPTAPSPQPAPVAASAPAKSAPAEAAPLIQPHLNADYLDNPPPAYPRISRRLGEQGKVLLRAMINTDGTVAQLAVQKTSGFSRLDQAALETVKHWRFVPARRGSQIVSAWVVVPISFSLEG
ncbi:energy transducer TonB [Methylobacter sp.]|uniref:energy transducer TonB n=1 Tax=Methylobacter sp. TaxID=2051955 RepID=UPI003DA3B264